MALQDEYTRLLMHLLPSGPAWEGDNPLLEGLAPSLARLHSRTEDLTTEIDPGSTVELIDRYEALCGLPDACAPDGVQTLVQRQRRLDAKVNGYGGINEAFYRRQLDALGYTTTTITQYQNDDKSPNAEWGDYWRYYWQVNIPEDANVKRMTCRSKCNEALRTWGDTIVECVIDKLCPSHTKVVFAYDGHDEVQEYSKNASN